jgi:hypothetical protein
MKIPNNSVIFLPPKFQRFHQKLLDNESEAICTAWLIEFAFLKRFVAEANGFCPNTNRFNFSNRIEFSFGQFIFYMLIPPDNCLLHTLGANPSSKNYLDDFFSNSYIDCVQVESIAGIKKRNTGINGMDHFVSILIKFL